MTAKQYNTTSVFVAACAGMAFFGVTMLSLAPILGKLNALVGEGALSLPSTMSIGIILGTVLFGPVVDRFGYKGLLIASSILALAGIQGLAHFTHLPLLHGSMFCLGLGGGILNGLTNAVVSDIYDDDKRGGRLGVLGAFYCIGALLWTLLNYFIADYNIPLNAISVVMALFIVFFCVTAFPKAKPSGSVSVSKSLGLLKYPALLLFAVVLFFESGFEGCSGSYTVEFFNQTTPMGTKAATLAMTWFTVGMMAGRFPLGAIQRRLKALGTLYTYLGVALAGVVLFTLCNGPLGAYIAMALIGFGVGATFPVVLNYIGGAFRDQSGTAMSIAIFIALLGQFTFNRLTGNAFAIGRYATLPALLFTAVVAMMIIVPIALRFTKNTTKKQ
ncbi:MAG: MFS transporter [Bacteroidales bacterium]|nr:MFS transporter [Bacteroidales bacterium]